MLSHLVYGGVPPPVGEEHIRTAVHQQLRHQEVALRSGDVKSRAEVVVRRVRIRAVLQQALQIINVACTEYEAAYVGR